MSADFTPTRGEYVSLTPFRYWCQKILPLTYDDSMSYYELLCKVVDCLNKAMEDVETLNTDIDNVYTAYDTLQDYVNTYFDNLDVQNEINSKLDEMAESGELASIINPFVYQYVSSVTGEAVTNWLNDNVDPVGSAVTVDRTLSVSGSAGDSKTIGDFFRSINSSTGLELNSGELWEVGGINTTTGANVESPGRVRTKKYLPTNTKLIKIPDTRGFFILAYRIGDIYVGAYKSSGKFVTDGSEYGYNTSFDLEPLQRLYPMYRFRLEVYSRGSDNVALSETINWSITNSLYSLITTESYNTSNAYNINNTNLWERGAIRTDNGANVQNSERVRTKWFIPSNSSYIKIDSTRGFFVLAYDVEGNYVGAYKSDNTFVKDGSESGYDTLDIGQLMSNFPTYRFKLSVYARSNPPIALSECENWLISNSLFNYLDITTNVSNNKNINTIKLWTRGSINTSNGKDVYNNERVRTNKFIPTNAEIIQIDSTRGFYILAYNLDGSYVGAYKSDGTFVIDGSESGYNTQFDIGSLQEKYPNYRFRLSVYARSNPPVNLSECANWTLTNSILNTDTIDLCIGEYNIGKFNMGNSGGISSDVETKIYNYKKFFATTNADAFMLLECTENIDSNNVYNTNNVLFDPIYLYRSRYEKETEIVSQHRLYNTQFSYMHTSGDPSAWCIYGYTIIKNRRIALVSALLNVTANTEQKIRALNKLLETLLIDFDYAVIGMDTNALSATEADAIKEYMNTHDYVSGNWGYLGYMDTYNLSSTMYHSIDNIFVKGGKIVDFEVPDVYTELSSDHYPVIAKIRLT